MYMYVLVLPTQAGTFTNDDNQLASFIFILFLFILVSLYRLTSTTKTMITLQLLCKPAVIKTVDITRVCHSHDKYPSCLFLTGNSSISFVSRHIERNRSCSDSNIPPATTSVVGTQRPIVTTQLQLYTILHNPQLILLK